MLNIILIHFDQLYRLKSQAEMRSMKSENKYLNFYQWNKVIIHNQLFFLIIDHKIIKKCIDILISFLSRSLSCSLFSFSHSWNAFSFYFSPIAEWFNLSLAAIDLIYSHIIAYVIESSPAVVRRNDRYWIACCVFLSKRKIWLRKIDLTALSVWVIEQTIADPCWLWGWIGRSAFFFFPFFFFFASYKWKCLTISVLNRLKVMLCVNENERELNNTVWVRSLVIDVNKRNEYNA